MNKTVKLLLVLVFVFSVSVFGKELAEVETKLSIFPPTISPGDTCYLLVTATNLSDQPTGIVEPGFQWVYSNDMVQFDLSRDGNIWHGTFEDWIHIEVDRAGIDAYRIPARGTIVLMALPLQFPPLEDLHDPFWEANLKELENHPEGLVFDFGIDFARSFFPGIPRIRLTDKVTIRLRNPEEMALIEKWYQNTPKDFFPVIDKGIYIRKVPPKGIRLESAKKILSNSPWNFITMGNRYPSDPNAPKTWQEWLELEESLSPSTMRDEIRLTRMLIQYCDTEDAKVLEELKTWFAEMNEIQRTVMAKSVLDRARKYNSHGEFFNPHHDIYQTIHEYYITPKSSWDEKHLKNLRLLE